MSPLSYKMCGLSLLVRLSVCPHTAYLRASITTHTKKVLINTEVLYENNIDMRKQGAAGANTERRAIESREQRKAWLQRDRESR